MSNTEHRWQVVNTWNDGAGGRKVVFTSSATGNAGHNACFEWIHRNTSFSFDEATRNQGYEVTPLVVTPEDEEIIEGMARGAWVSVWADNEEENGRTYPGQRLDLIAPETHPVALEWAQTVALDLSVLNGGKAPHEIFQLAVNAGYRNVAESFGFAVALQTMGHGVSWHDDLYGKGDVIKIPRSEFYFPY